MQSRAEGRVQTWETDPLGLKSQPHLRSLHASESWFAHLQSRDMKYLSPEGCSAKRDNRTHEPLVQRGSRILVLFPPAEGWRRNVSEEISKN